MATLPTANKEVNAFAKGIITEASPLNFPEGASFSEDNFDLLRDSTRQRRQGIDYENNYSKTNVGSKVDIESEAISSYEWANAGANFTNNYIVVQIGAVLYFFNNNTENPSGNLVDSITVNYDNSTERGDQVFQFATVNGDLIISNLHPTDSIPTVIVIITDDGSGNFNLYESTISIRDVYGVEDNLFLTTNPSSLSDNHKYNLLNQGWPESNILQYKSDEGNYPNNTEIWHLGKYTDVGSGKQKFSSDQVTGYDFGNTKAPRGRNIINAFFRGETRFDSTLVTDANKVDNSVTSTSTSVVYSYNGASSSGYVATTETTLVTDVADKVISSLPKDRDENPTVQSIASAFGRLWFAGVYRDSVTDADDLSPDYSSYIFFSQVIKNNKSYGKCYQENDPTSENISDIIDTDGGYINILEANNIRVIESVGSYLVVLAENGIWAISGGTDGFSATAYRLDKVSDAQLIGPNSVVKIEEGLLIWAKSGIYAIVPTKSGFGLDVQNITRETIQSLYDDIPSLGKKNVVGVYDSPAKKVRWLYNDNSDGNYNSANLLQRYNRELVFDKVLGAFYTSTIYDLNSNSPFVIGISRNTEFTERQAETNVVNSSGTQVVNTSGVNVIIKLSIRDNSISSTKYLTLAHNSNGTDYDLTFSEYIDSSFHDWKTEDGVGVDAPAKLVTGYFLENDSQRKKGLKYLTTHFNRTETGFTDDGTGNLSAKNPSSCKMRVRWDFADSTASGKYSPEFQAYRILRPYFPSGTGDTFDYGQSVITTKNKIRGSGRAMQIEFNTEENNDLQLLGWAMAITGVKNV